MNQEPNGIPWCPHCDRVCTVKGCNKCLLMKEDR